MERTEVLWSIDLEQLDYIHNRKSMFSVTMTSSAGWLRLWGENVAENSTSAFDAIRVLLGVTIGNQRLMLMDCGRHNYTRYREPKNKGWIFRLKAMNFGDEEALHWMEEKIITNNVLFEDIVQFQKLVVERVR